MASDGPGCHTVNKRSMWIRFISHERCGVPAPPKCYPLCEGNKPPSCVVLLVVDVGCCLVVVVVVCVFGCLCVCLFVCLFVCFVCLFCLLRSYMASVGLEMHDVEHLGRQSCATRSDGSN